MTRRACLALCVVLLAFGSHRGLAQEESSAEAGAQQELSPNSPSLPSGASGSSGESSETSAQIDAAREFIDLVYAPEYPRTTKDVESYVQQKFARHPYFSSFFLHSIDVSSSGTPVSTFLGNNIRAYKIAKPDMSVPIKPEDQDPAKAEPDAPKPSEMKTLPKKKRILFTSGLQGDQRTGIVQTLDLMGYVLRNPAVQKRLEDTGMELWFIPIVNPDGYDVGRRKNLHLGPCLGSCNDWKPGSNITSVSSTTVAPGSCRAEWVSEWNTVIDEFLKHNPNMKRDELCRTGLVYKDGSFINGGTDIDSNFPSFQPDLLDGQICRSADPLSERFSPTAILIDEKTGQAKFKMDMTRDTALESETSAVMMFAESLQPWAAVSVHSGAETGSIVLPDREVTCQNEDFFMRHVCGGWDKHKKLNHVPAELQSLLSCGHGGDRQCGNLQDFLANNYGTIAVKLNLHSGKRESMDKPLNFGPVPKKAAELAGLPENAFWKQLRLFSEYFIEFIAGLSDRIPGPKLTPTSAREVFKAELKSFKCREGKFTEKSVAATAAVAQNQAPSEGADPQAANDGPAEQPKQQEAPSANQEAPSQEQASPQEQAPAAGGDDAPRAGDAPQAESAPAGDAPQAESAPAADGSAGDSAPNGQAAEGPTEARFGGRRLSQPTASDGEQDLQSNIRQSVTGIAEAINEIESVMKKESEQLPHWIGKPKARNNNANRKTGSVFTMEPANDLYEGWPW